MRTVVALLLLTLPGLTTASAAHGSTDPQPASEVAGSPTRGDGIARAAALIEHARHQDGLGQQTGVIESLQAALQQLEGSDRTDLVAIALAGLGHAWTQTGQLEEAGAALERGLALSDSLPATLTATLLGSRADLQQARGDTSAALADYDRAAGLARSGDDTVQLAGILVNGLRIAAQTGSADSARFSAAYTAIGQLPDSGLKAGLLANLGQGASRLATDGNPLWLEHANRALQESARIAGASGDQRVLSFALGYRGTLYENQGRDTDALTLTRRAGYAAQACAAPESLYLWQWQEGRLLKQRQDIDGAIAAYRGAVSTLQGVRSDIGTGAGGRSYREAAAPIHFELADLLLGRARKTQDIEAARRDLLEARDQVENLKAAELQDYFQDDCVTQLQNRTVRLEEVAQRTAILYPIMLEDRLELLLTLPNGLQQFTFELPAARVITEVRRLRLLLEKRTSREYLRPAGQLYKWLIEPLQETLQEQQVDTLIVVPDGALRTIPLGALYDAGSKQYLIEQYAIAYTPGLFLTDARALPRDNLQLLLNGLTVGSEGFPPLPNVATELQQIHSLYENSEILQDEDFIVSNVQGALQKTPYSIVHIASHGQFSSDRDQTFLLAWNERLSIDRLEQLMGLSQYREQPVELLALSACQTAAGDDRAALGLAGIAVKAGARSALATLWFVSDEATSQLIADFYRELADPEVSKARALQHAQIRLLQDRRYRHAGYWAPYLLIGNWL